MKKLFSLGILFCLFAFTAAPAHAKIKFLKSSNVFEGETVKVRAVKFNSRSNPLTASLVDGTGTVFTTSLTTKKIKGGFSFVAPSVARTRTLSLKVHGGNVLQTDAQTLPLVVFNAPDLSNPDPTPPEGELEVTNLSTESLIFNDFNLTADTQGQLLWDGKRFIDRENSLFGQRLVMDEISLQVSTQGSLLWNSHPIISDDGKLSTTGIFSGNGNLSFETSKSGNKTIIQTADQGGTLSLPPNGQVISVLRGEFDSTIDTGVTGFTDLRNATLPANSRVTRVWYEVLETVTSATDASSIGISIPVDDINGLLAPITINDGTNPWDQGAHVGIQNGLLTHISNKTTDARNVQLTIAGEALTAGKIVVFIEYMLLP